MISRDDIPKIRIAPRRDMKWDNQQQKHVPVTNYQADCIFDTGENYHGIGDTPAMALLEMTKYWLVRTGQ